MEVIQEVDSSDANSIGFHSPHAKIRFFKFNSASRMEDESEEGSANSSQETVEVVQEALAEN
jgi:hypothetical protein